jgi:hypothetical protein
VKGDILALVVALGIYPLAVLLVAITGPHHPAEKRERDAARAARRPLPERL